MTWFLFMDESGHDHKNMPFEVRGGVALPVHRFWKFAQDWRQLEIDCFGVALAEFRKEVKGEKLLDKDRRRWAQQCAPLSKVIRTAAARSFLERGATKPAQKQSSETFAAYGQACELMAFGVFDLLRAYDAKLFATVIPKGTRKPKGFDDAAILRKDFVFLLERFYYFLESSNSPGILVADETDKVDDARFVRRMAHYFSRTKKGQERSKLIVPTPLFVASDMSIGVQAADIALYCLNWGYREPRWETTSTVRPDIAADFAARIESLQWKGMSKGQDMKTYPSKSIVLVPDPYHSRELGSTDQLRVQKR